MGPAGGEIELSQTELRETMNDFFYKFSRTITESADHIIQASPSPVIDKEALIWKMNAIPIANNSIFNSDPFLGYVDVAVFTYQMKLYFQQGAGKELFGEYQPVAIQALDKLWEELLKIGRNLVPDNDISAGAKVVIDFAEQNPITSSYFIRQSTIPLMTKIQKAEKVTLKRLAIGMAESMEGLRSQISSYVQILPKQASWEAEYLLNNALTNPELSSRFDSIERLLERSVVLLESSPELVDGQREAAFSDIRAERIAIIQALRQEREIILNTIKNEREIVLALLTEQLTVQRQATFQELTTLTNQSLEFSFGNMNQMVDKLFWRSVILISILGIFILIAIILYKKI